MARYIDAVTVKEEKMKLKYYTGSQVVDILYSCLDYMQAYEVIKKLAVEPSAEVREVVRCKDCDWFIVNEIKADGTTDKRYKPTWCTYHCGYMNDDDFCSYGERNILPKP